MSHREALLNRFVRQVHRWVSIAFTLGVIANTVIISSLSGAQPDYWVYLLALVPLALLLVTGLYLFVLPYAANWRSARR